MKAFLDALVIFPNYKYEKTAHGICFSHHAENQKAANFQYLHLGKDEGPLWLLIISRCHIVPCAYLYYRCREEKCSNDGCGNSFTEDYPMALNLTFASNIWKQFYEKGLTSTEAFTC